MLTNGMDKRNIQLILWEDISIMLLHSIIETIPLVIIFGFWAWVILGEEK